MVPSVRARHMKTFLEAIDALKPSEAQSIRALANPDTLAEVESCLPSAWLPIEMDVELTEHVSNVLGAARAHQFYQKLTLGDYETSVFKSFIDMTVRMIGLSPSTYVKMVPHGFGLIYRDYGSFRALEREEDRRSAPVLRNPGGVRQKRAVARIRAQLVPHRLRSDENSRHRRMGRRSISRAGARCFRSAGRRA